MAGFFYSLDLKLLYFINHSLSNPVFDIIMPFFREKLTWVPLYLVVVYFMIKKYGLKSLWVIGFAILTVVLCDQISSGWIKPFFERNRPCNNPEISNWLNLPIGKGSGWSFVSSHASNHFGLAVYFSMIFMGFKNQLRIILPFLLWAMCIALAQVYIGFHYPSDVLVGGAIGAIIGFGMAKLNCLVLCYRSGSKI
jgi:membrane-associated phospholipid phosphatase